MRWLFNNRIIDQDEAFLRTMFKKSFVPHIFCIKKESCFVHTFGCISIDCFILDKDKKIKSILRDIKPNKILFFEGMFWVETMPGEILEVNVGDEFVFV